MSNSAQFRSGKGAGDENFPVASWLIRPRYRPVILAFYNFVRTADDIADHSTMSAPDKLAHLDRLEASLLGGTDEEPEAVRLRGLLCERGLSTQHARDLLNAFRQDVTRLRYADWDDLISYCRLSAMPVGRFVLDVHGESQAAWGANDALCAALQIINHLQDCRADYLNLDRVYIPQDALAAHGLGVAALGETHASPALKACLHGLAGRTAELLEQSRGFPSMIVDARLAMEVAAIQRLAERLVELLRLRDPLSERVHLSKLQMLMTGLGAAAGIRARRLFGRGAPVYRAQTRRS
jgi:squalene synthase HpnC